MEIKKRKYTGYIWMSDTDIPKVLREEEYSKSCNDSDNPFIIEAQLYCKEEKASVSVKYVDGKYIYREYDNVSPEQKSENKSLIEYVSNSKIGKETLLFLQCWDEKEDDLCLKMKTLRQGKMIFVGFKG